MGFQVLFIKVFRKGVEKYKNRLRSVSTITPGSVIYNQSKSNELDFLKLILFLQIFKPSHENKLFPKD